MRADHRQDLSLANGVQHSGGVLAGIDDDDLVIVADDPRVCPAADAFDPRAFCCHRNLPSVQWCVGLTTREHDSPSGPTWLSPVRRQWHEL